MGPRFTGWSEQWATQPSFFVGEYAFIALAIIALVHARACGRAHVIAWIAALVAGTANDVFFMALPLVDNFWQAQATIMITPRLPLYIPCVYVCFLYIPRVASWRLGLPRWSGPAASGLAAILFYEAYDIIGAKFLWWTWHDTDPTIALRFVGSPVGSIIFVIALAAAYAWLLDRGLGGRTTISRGRFIGTLALVAVGTTPLMMIAMAPLQQLDGGLPGGRGLAVFVVLFVVLVVLGLGRRTSTPRFAADRRLWIATVVYFAVLAAIALVFDPAQVVSTGVHQTLGPCDVLATDLGGHVRHEFLCATDFSEAQVLCRPQASDTASWYTVCGTPHADYAPWIAAILAITIAGAAAFTWMLKPRST
ncbi:MAG TPA: hypothetical protein VG755_03600 [Nannocystaceae bacterium]|nr:hypothetical protein [Nannocystaceae bacterium]